MLFYKRLIPHFSLAALVTVLCSLPVLAQVVPAELPRADDTPPATDKPVKIYIFSGQSNSLGFGRAEGGSVHYPSFVLSADPTIKPANLPISSAGLLPHLIFQDEKGEKQGAKAWVYKGTYDPAINTSSVEEAFISLGDVTQYLPSIDGPSYVVVKGFIEVPMTGMHVAHSGYGDSEYAMVTINGKEVYRKTTDDPATTQKIKLEAGKRHPIEIVYFKGGKASFWMELVDLAPRGTLRHMIEEKGLYTNLLDANGKWIVRNDVVVNDAYMGKGKSVPFSPTWRRGTFGPEVGFGSVIGTFHDEPVILMKADIGNRGLAWDMLPPGSERYEVDGKIYAGYKDTQSAWPKEQGEPKPGGWYAGRQYDEYTAAIHHVLNNFDEIYPQYKDQGYEIAGFVWWQGHKDQNDVHASRYAQNLANLIKAWRKEFKAPDAKWVVATIAFGGWELDGPGKTIAEAQLSVDGDTGKFPEFKGNVKTIEARDFWRTAGESPKNQGYHYNHNGETYFLVGDALARAMVELQGGKAEQRQFPPRPEAPDVWPDKPTLEQAAQMVYSDAFLSPWSKNPAEPTAEDFKKMTPALEPYVMGTLMPNYVTGASSVPAYRRGGSLLEPIVTGETPKVRANKLASQLDTVIGYYKFMGIDDYDWSKFGPAMQTADWHYYSFMPKEPVSEKTKVQYREVSLPEGMDGWYAMDFDPKKAGWKTGQAPFGQKDGKQEALTDKCGNPQCGCDIKPNTLWENDMLLMRQTFTVPALKEGHSYRLVVGGGNHKWAGEGFAVYINGKLFVEQKGGFYKNGATSGAYFYNDTLPDLKSGKITVAVKGFLRRSGHRSKSAPPRGHLSVWLEELKLPELVTETIAAQAKQREEAKAEKKK